MSKARGDDHAVAILVENVAVQSKPPIHSQNAGMAIKAAKPRAASGPWKRGGIWSFIGLNSVGVDKTGGSGSENEIQNPKAFVFVAFDSLVVAKDGDAIGERVVVNVNESGT